MSKGSQITAELTKLPGVLRERLRAVSTAMAEERENKEFLPAHLELLETPASPYAVGFVRVICGIIVIALLWGAFANLDIHAVAAGRVQLSGRSKILQPPSGGIVKDVLTSNGASVGAGDLLVRLDPTNAETAYRAKKFNFDSLQGAIIHHGAVIRAVRNNLVNVVLDFPEGILLDVRSREEAAAIADLAQYVSARKSILAQREEKLADQERLKASITELENQQKILEELIKMQETLAAKSASTRAAVLDAKQKAGDVRANLVSAQGELLVAIAGASVFESRLQQWSDQTIADQTTKLTEALEKRDAAGQELIEAKHNLDLTDLRSPIDGTVQQLSITTIGQVVRPGETVLVVVPRQGAIEIEALVQNKDIGFVFEGQEATIKIDAFPFTRYGTIEGKVIRVSRDAVDLRAALGAADTLSASQGGSPANGTPETQNLVFPVTVELTQTTLHVDGKDIPLAPGMTGSVEIKTGSRSVMDYLLAPIAETTSSAGHER